MPSIMPRLSRIVNATEAVARGIENAWRHPFSTWRILRYCRPATCLYHTARTTITLEKNGRLVLPAVLRDGLHVREGAKLSAVLVGDHLELKPCGDAAPDSWPPGFFERIAIDDPAFARPPQGAMPAGVEF